MLISLFAFVTRFVVRLQSIARALMLVNLIIYFMRLFRSFYVSSYLGPKVIMITKMVYVYILISFDICYFTDERFANVLLFLSRLSTRVQCQQS